MTDPVIIKGACTGNTGKAVWIECPDNKRRLFALSKITLIEGSLVRGDTATVSMQPWVYDSSFVRGEQKEPTAKKIQPDAAIQAIPAAIPPAMLQRLIDLCAPHIHGNSKDSIIATGWLYAMREAEC